MKRIKYLAYILINITGTSFAWWVEVIMPAKDKGFAAMAWLLVCLFFNLIIAMEEFK